MANNTKKQCEKFDWVYAEEVQMRPLVVATPGFIQLAVPLPRQKLANLNKSWYSHYQRVRLYLQNLSHPTP
jgi:hypothetical protein